MDIELVESLNGGEMVARGRDVSVIRGLLNMPYLAMFGGNSEASTPQLRLPSEQDFSWWGNALETDSGLQFNSETERALNEIPLTSAGRVLIEQAVKRDLRFMRDFAEVGVSVTIPATDKVVIAVRIIEPDNLQQRDFVYIWDATNSELTERETPPPPGVEPVDYRIFDYTFDFSFS